ncbi:MAG: tetratricopeptide repeat protein [Verrucomicrobia bacterium]|nr:tetratricopeptide repeat protein [Verrucomicrobiota bacterium]
MPDLQPPDAQFLVGAMGWLELGLPAEAHRELDRIAPAHQQHPDVLEMRWQVCAAQPDWSGALRAAEALVAAAPERDSGWIHRAYALRRAPGGSLQHAWDALRPAADRFPRNALVPFNLACYAAQFGRLDEAWDWLQRAMKTADNASAIRQMALADDDLKPLWDRLRQT